MLLEELEAGLRGDIMSKHSIIEVRVKRKGFNMSRWLKRLSELDYIKILTPYAQSAIDALRAATPVDSGKTAESWVSKISYDGKDRVSIDFYNTNENDGVNVALILQLGHGTGTGGWVEGRDYISPAIQPVFDALAKDCWKAVTKK